MKLWPVLAVLTIPLPSVLMVAQAARVDVPFARLPLYFEPDQDSFCAQAAGGRLELTADSVRGPVTLRLEGARHNGRLEGVGRLASQSHYLLGNDPAKWQTHVPNYARVRIRDAWPGIDVVYYGTRSALEFDFVIAAGADPSRIQFVAEGGRLRDPVIYQETPVGRRLVVGRYSRRGSRVAFQLAAYDRRHPLVIDPVIEYATALGGGAADAGMSIAVDNRGAAYVFGLTYSGNFPVANALQPSAAPGRHLFVAKLAPGGGALEYSTFLGGTAAGNQYSGDTPGGIGVDAAGSAYLTGSTNSPDFPIAGPAPLQKTFGYGANFGARLSVDGSALVYSTPLGSGGFQTTRLAVDPSGIAYFTGLSNANDFPLVNPMPTTLPGSPGGNPLYAVKLRPDGTPVYSTFPTGRRGDIPTGIAADNDGNAYITGMAAPFTGVPPGFPLVNALQSTPRSANSPFVAKLNADGSSLIYSTYFGGSENDRITAIAADASGNAYITGMTNSADFPTVKPLQSRLAGAAMYKSTDGGVTSSRSDANLPGGAAAVAVDPVNSATLYATVPGSYGETWLYRSTNAGGYWGYLKNVTALALDPSTSGTLYVGSGSSIMKSADAGATWTKIYDGRGQVRALAVDPRKPLTIYAGYGGGGDTDGVYSTVDGGANWTPVFVGSMHGVRFLAISPMNSTVYVLTGMGFTPSPQPFQLSADGGQSWSPVPNLPNLYPSGMAFDPRSPATFYVLESGVIYKTTDGGQSFTAHLVGTGSNDPASMAIDPSNSSTLYVATSRGVYKSVDGGQSWNATAIIGSVNAVAVDASSTVYASESIQPDAFVAKLNPQGTALLYSTFLGGTGPDSAVAIAADGAGDAYVTGSTSSADFPWKNPPPPLSSSGNQFLTKLDPSGSSLVYATPLNSTIAGLAVDSTGAVYLTGSTSQTDFPAKNPIQTFTTGTFFQSSDGGATWTGVTSGDAFTSSIQHLALDPQNPSQVFAQTQTNIYRSTDGGASFSKLFLHPPPPIPNILSLALDPRTPTTLYAGTGPGADFGVYQSNDDGQSWSRVGNVTQVNALAVSSVSSSTLFAATDGGLMMSGDSGLDWTQSGSFYNVYTVVFDPQNPHTLYASAAFDGVFKSTDGGASWSAINSGFPNAGGPAAKVLAVDPFNHSVIYAAGRDGIFRSGNSGASWNAIDAGLRVRQGYWVSAFAVDPVTPSTLYAGLDSGGLYKTTDGGVTWTLTGLALPTISDIAVDSNNSGHILAGAYFNPYDAFIVKIGE